MREVEETRPKVSDKQLAETIEEVGVDIEEQLNQHLLVSATNQGKCVCTIHTSVLPRNNESHLYV